MSYIIPQYNTTPLEDFCRFLIEEQIDFNVEDLSDGLDVIVGFYSMMILKDIEKRDRNIVAKHLKFLEKNVSSEREELTNLLATDFYPDLLSVVNGNSQFIEQMPPLLKQDFLNYKKEKG